MVVFRVDSHSVASLWALCGCSGSSSVTDIRYSEKYEKTKKIIKKGEKNLSFL